MNHYLDDTFLFYRKQQYANSNMLRTGAKVRNLGLCHAADDDEVSLPVPLRISKSEDSDETHTISTQCSRQNSIHSYGLYGTAPLTIMKRRARHVRPPLDSYLYADTEERVHGQDVAVARRISSSPPDDQTRQKARSLGFPKAGGRRSSLFDSIRRKFSNNRKASTPVANKETWTPRGSDNTHSSGTAKELNVSSPESVPPIDSAPGQ